MTKRKLLLYALLVAILIGSVPFFIGQYIESQYYQFLTRVSEFDSVTFRPISYNRHWRKSYAKSKITLTQGTWQKFFAQWQMPSYKIPPLSFLLEHEIQHGPVIQLHKSEWKLARAFIRSKISLTEEARKFLEAQVGTANLVQFESEMNLQSGDITIAMQGKPFKTREQAQNDPPAWGGIDGIWKLNSAMDQLKAQIAIPGFNFDINKNNYRAQDLYFIADRKRNKNGFWEGSGSIQVQNLKLDDTPNNIQTLLDGLFVSGKLDVKNSIVQGAFLIRAELLKINAESLGPIHYNFSVANIPEDVLQLFKHLLKTAPAQQNIWDHVLLNPKFLSYLPKLLKNRPTFVMDNMFVQTKYGPLTGTMHFHVGGEGAHSLTHLNKLLDSLLIQVQLKIPQPLFKQFLAQLLEKKQLRYGMDPVKAKEFATKNLEDTLHDLLNQGYLKSNPTHYEIDALFANGTLKIFGVPKAFPKNLLE